MKVRELLTLIGFDVDEAGAKKADKLFKGLSIAATAVVGTVTAAAVGLAYLTHRVSEAGDHAAKAGKRLGITAEEVQELGFAGGQSGTSFEAISGGLRTLQRVAVAATQGNKTAAATFSRLGISVKDANGHIKPTTQLLREVADKISKTADPAKRTALAAAALGRGFGPELLPFLMEGGAGIEALQAEARALGNVMSNEAAAAAEELNDQFGRLSFATQGVSTRLGVKLFPIALKVTTALTDLLVANRELIDRGINLLVRGVSFLVNQLFELAKLINEHKVLFVAFLAIAILPLLQAFGLLGIAAIQAGLAMLAPVLPWLLLAGLLALIIEDIYVFATGGESALGDLLKAFELMFDWVMEWIGETAQWFVDGFKAVGDTLVVFFREAFELIEGIATSVWTTIATFVVTAFSTAATGLRDVFVGVIDEWKNLVLGFVRFVAESLPSPVRDLLMKGVSAVDSGLSSVQGAAAGLLDVSLLGGSSPLTSPLPLLAGASSSSSQSISVAGANIEVNIAGNAKADEVCTATQSGVDQANQKAADEIASRFRSR